MDSETEYTAMREKIGSPGFLNGNPIHNESGKAYLKYLKATKKSTNVTSKISNVRIAKSVPMPQNVAN
jgi:hypothetical protein